MTRVLVAAVLLVVSACAPESKDDHSVSNSLERPHTMDESPQPVHGITFTSITGEPMPLAEFKGTVTLVVNTASRCGYTGQYAGLQELYETFKDQGFSIIGVPSNDFGAQEPGTEEQIASFCEINYGVEFPLTRKTVVSGEEQHPFWQLARETLGDKANPKWNFHKVLIGSDGQFLQAYPSAIRPADVELVADIERAISERR